MSRKNKSGKPTKSTPTDASEEELVATDDAAIGRALRWSWLAISLLACGIGGYVWYTTRPLPKPIANTSEYVPPTKRRTHANVKLPEVRFTDVTEAAGIRFQHSNGSYGQKLLPETMGSGAAFFDYDNDGDADLLLVNACFWPWTKPAESEHPTPALYQNDGHGNFTDVTAAAELTLSCYGMGVACGDFDGDGWTDLFITSVGKNHLLRNNQGKFVDVTAAAGVGGSDDQWTTSSTFCDFNHDGRLDLFVCNYIHWTQAIDLSLGSTLDGQTRAYGPPTSFQGAFSYLYRNDGEGKFTDVSAESGIQVKNTNTKVPVGKSLGVVATDLDDDGFVDLVVANDTVQNFVFHNRGMKNNLWLGYEEIGTPAGVAFDRAGSARGAMGIDVAKFRNSETQGVVIGNFADEEMSLYVSQGEPLLFTDEAMATGLGPQSRLELKFGVFFFDYDLDGRLDILSANGHLEEDIAKVKTDQRYRQSPQLYWNAGDQGDSEFIKVPSATAGEDFAKPLVGRGSCYADIDGDGDLDVLLTDCGSSPRLLRNEQKLGGHWLRIHLTGKGPNPEALGSRVRVRTGTIWQERTVTPTHGYLSQSELVVTFGLGASEKIDQLEIIWADGTKQDVPPPAVNQLHKIVQP